MIEAGDMLTEGSVNPHDVLAVKGELAVQDYLIQRGAAGLPDAGC